MRPYGYVYLIHCTQNQKDYVGQTTQEIHQRWKQHQKGGCTVLKSAISKYGAKSFTVTVLDTAEDQDDLDRKEIGWISALNTLVPFGYNLKKGGDGGGATSDQARLNMRIAQLGKKQSPDVIERRTAKLRGKKRPEEVCLKLKKAWQKRERKISDLLREKLSVAHQGKKPSEETKQKMAAAQKARRSKESLLGVKPNFSQKGLDALRVARTGTKLSEETKQKMRDSRNSRGQSLGFLTTSQQASLRQIASSMTLAERTAFTALLRRPQVDNEGLISEFNLSGRDRQEPVRLAREALLQDPSLFYRPNEVGNFIRVGLSSR